jgi:nucleoside-diphosphate-sugar epimerase
VRVTVLGGTGFIGRHVTRWLVEAGAEVTTIQRGRAPDRLPAARTIVADRTQSSPLAAALAAAAPQVLVDMIAYSGQDMERLLAALPLSVGRLVVISSGDVYWTYGAFLGLGSGPAPTGPLDEGSPLRQQLYPYRAQATGPDDPLYWYEKITVEQAARAAVGLAVTILRLPMVYGPGDPQRRVGGCLERLRAADGPFHLNAGEAAWRCTRGYVEDVAWAIGLAALDERAAGEIFNVGEDVALPEIEWLREVAAAAGWPGGIVTDAATPPSLPVNWGMPLAVDTSRIRALLRYREPIGRQEGLRRAIADPGHVGPPSHGSTS